MDLGLNKPFPAYEGNESFVFVCYAHRDSDSVYADLEKLHSDGIHLWYDEGITAGVSWRAEIAAAITGATRFLFYVSEASLNSTHCLREVDYALSHEIEILPVYLDDSTLPAELELALNRVQALFRETDTRYIEHLFGGLEENAQLVQLPLSRVSERQNKLSKLPIRVVVISLMALFFWMQRDSFFSRQDLQPETPSVATAFDHYLEGLALMERWDKDDNLETAIVLFRKATVLDPGFALAFARSADALRRRYSLTRDESWLDQASADVNEAVRMNAGLAPVQVALGRVHSSQGNIDLAVAALERALAIDANDAVANMAIAFVYQRLGRLQYAEAAFQKAVALDSENISVLDAYANFLYGQSRFEDATRYWQAAIRLAPDHYASLVNLGSVLNERGRIPEAITMYHRVIKIRPTYMAYSNLGTAYSMQERYPEAMEAYQEALEIDDNDWLAWGNLAYVYSWVDGSEQQANETF